MCIEYRQLEIEENTLLFEEGDTGNTAYLLRRGRIELSKYIDGHKRVFSIQKAPVMFGEMALIMKDHQRTASARAVEDCELVEVSQEAFNCFFPCPLTEALPSPQKLTENQTGQVMRRARPGRKENAESRVVFIE